jgi:hypothetical protein
MKNESKDLPAVVKQLLFMVGTTSYFLGLLLLLTDHGLQGVQERIGLLLAGNVLIMVLASLTSPDTQVGHQRWTMWFGGMFMHALTLLLIWWFL